MQQEFEEEWVRVELDKEYERFYPDVVDGKIAISNKLRYLDRKGRASSIHTLNGSVKHFIVNRAYNHFVEEVEEDVCFTNRKVIDGKVDYKAKLNSGYYSSVYDMAKFKRLDGSRLIKPAPRDDEYIFDEPDGNWVNIPNVHEDYRIQRDGSLRVFNHTGEFRIIHPWSRPSYSVKRNYTFNTGETDPVTGRTIRATYTLQRLLYMSFIGEIPEGMYVGRKNGNHRDYRLENLCLTNKKPVAGGDYSYYRRLKIK